VQYDFGIDGISLLLILLTTFMGIIAVVSSYSAIDHGRRSTTSSCYFCRRHDRHVLRARLLPFYVFWEIMLVPMYFIIGIWGGRGSCTRPSSSSSTR